MSQVSALGFDVGSATAKLAAVDESGAMVWHLLEPTEPHIERQAERMLAEARARSGSDRPPMVATGYGRKLIPGADRVVTEITCHARGVFEQKKQAGTLIDIGGQDSKVIAIGPDGRVINFAMNDKCAAGTGRFLEVSSARLGLALDELGPTALDSVEEVSISSTCTVFAESEIVSLLARGAPVPQVVRGLTRSLVSRVCALARSIQPKPPYMLSGGVARNPAVRAFLAEALGAGVDLPDQPQIMGAYGAALIGLRPG